MTLQAPAIDTIDVLLVEDSPSDAELTRHALREAEIELNLHIVEDGDAALRFLRREEEYANAPLPDMILLDLNLPGKDGCEVLTEIKADPALCSIPVVILTTSQAQEDIIRTYNLHASSYVTKSLDLCQLVRVIRSIKQFWLNIGEPRREVLDLISPDVAHRLQVIPLEISGDTLTLAMLDTGDEEAIEEVESMTHFRIQPCPISAHVNAHDLRQVIRRLYADAESADAFAAETKLLSVEHAAYLRQQLADLREAGRR